MGDVRLFILHSLLNQTKNMNHFMAKQQQYTWSRNEVYTMNPLYFFTVFFFLSYKYPNHYVSSSTILIFLYSLSSQEKSYILINIHDNNKH